MLGRRTMQGAQQGLLVVQARGWMRGTLVALGLMSGLAGCQTPAGADHAVHAVHAAHADAGGALLQVTPADPQRPAAVPLAAFAAAQTDVSAPVAAFDAGVEALMRQAQVPGMAVAVIRGGQLVYLRGYGLASPAHDGRPARPMRPDTVMRAASLTKAAFAWTVVQLAEEGRLNLDQPLSQALSRPLPAYPEWVDLAGDDRWKGLTLRQLLSHQSGLLNWRFINLNQKLDFKFSPGQRYVYSGEGYQIAQRVVEERLGQTVEALMRERIEQPLGLKDQRMSTSAEQAEAWGQRLARPVSDDAKVLPLSLSGRSRAAGSMATTPSDYAAFLRSVLRREGLSPASHRDMLRPQLAIDSPRQFPSHWPGQTDVNAPIGLGAGLGWVVYRGPYGRTFFKEGHDTGVSNLALGFADRGDGLLLMSNSNRAEAIFWPVVETLWPASCLPWFWMGYVPEDQAAWRSPQARETPRGPGQACLNALARRPG